MLSMRERTQPALSACMRTKLQSSTGTGAAAPCAAGLAGATAWDRESSCQFEGGAGGLGGGAATKCRVAAFFFLVEAARFMAGFGEATATRGATRCPTTSTDPPSGI